MREMKLAVLIVTGIGVAAGCTQSAAPAPSVVAGTLVSTAAIPTATLLTGRTNSFAVLVNPSKATASATSVPFHIQHPVEFPLQQFGPRVIVFRHAISRTSFRRSAGRVPRPAASVADGDVICRSGRRERLAHRVIPLFIEWMQSRPGGPAHAARDIDWRSAADMRSRNADISVARAAEPLSGAVGSCVS